MPDEELRLADVLAYLDDCDAKFLSELELARPVLHRRPPRGWTVAQIVHHLIRAERTMMVIWKVAPALDRWPRLLRAIDGSNAVLWRALGMKAIDRFDGPITPAGAESGRIRTPVFLDPRPRRFDYAQLLDWRRATRVRTRRTVEALGERDLYRATWTIPTAGTFPLIELIRFIGIHEMHHLPQIRRLRAL